MGTIRGRAWLLAGLVAIGGEAAFAQPSAVVVPGVIEGDVVEGLISRVDPRARTITLDNGRDYLVPEVIALDWARLPAGTPVRVRYSVDAGRNIATRIDLAPTS